MKTLLIDDFTAKLFSKLYTGVYLKGTKKSGSKIINRQLFHRISAKKKEGKKRRTQNSVFKR